MTEQQTEKRLSETLENLGLEISAKETVSIGEMFSSLEERAFGIAIIIFSLPNSQPFSMIPGMSTIFALPVLLLAIQMLLGYHKMWLPRFISGRKLPPQAMGKVLIKSARIVRKVERVIKPRMLWLSDFKAQKLIGLVIMLLSMLISLPIPFGNTLPALATVMFAIGIIERDGWFIIGGIIFCIAGIIVATMVVLSVLGFASLGFSLL